MGTWVSMNPQSDNRRGLSLIITDNYNHLFLVLNDANVNESNSEGSCIGTNQLKENISPDLNGESKEKEYPNCNVEKPTIAPNKNLKTNSDNCTSNWPELNLSPSEQMSTSLRANVQYSSDVGGFVDTTVNKQSLATAPDGAPLPVLSKSIGEDPTTPISDKKIKPPGNSIAPIIAHNKVMPLNIKTRSNRLPPIASNKVSPLPRETEIPLENQVVCAVDVHRENESPWEKGAL